MFYKILSKAIKEVMLSQEEGKENVGVGKEKRGVLQDRR